jgi:predicted membrane protein
VDEVPHVGAVVLIWTVAQPTYGVGFQNIKVCARRCCSPRSWRSTSSLSDPECSAGSG